MLSLLRYLRLMGLVTLSLFFVSACSGPEKEIPEPEIDLAFCPKEVAERFWPALLPLNAPDSLRPCCAFGYDLKVSLFGIPVPFYSLNNIADNDRLGEHHYNDSMWTGIANLSGLGSEKLGILYTEQGGFIDIAHVRDTADNTLFLFSQIICYLGEEKTLVLKSELFERRIQLKTFQVPADPIERYTLAAYLSGYLAYQLAAWHEVAQWYGFTSVPGFSEEISAFSPEDLYSNLLGARLAVSLILQGYAHDVEQYNLVMAVALNQALKQLNAVQPSKTKAYFDSIDGKWWDSSKRIPDKYLVIHRDYSLSNSRQPALIEGSGIALALPEQWGSYQFIDLAEFQLWPGDSNIKMLGDKKYLTIRDAQQLADLAEKSEQLIR